MEKSFKEISREIKSNQKDRANDSSLTLGGLDELIKSLDSSIKSEFGKSLDTPDFEPKTQMERESSVADLLSEIEKSREDFKPKKEIIFEEETIVFEERIAPKKKVAAKKTSKPKTITPGSVAALKAEAKELGIKGYTKMKKSQLTKAIKKHNAPAEVEVAETKNTRSKVRTTKPQKTNVSIIPNIDLGKKSNSVEITKRKIETPSNQEQINIKEIEKLKKELEAVKRMKPEITAGTGNYTKSGGRLITLQDLEPSAFSSPVVITILVIIALSLVAIAAMMLGII